MTDLRNVEIRFARNADWELMKRVNQHSPNICSMSTIVLKDLEILCHLIPKTPTRSVPYHFVIEKNEAERR